MLGLEPPGLQTSVFGKAPGEFCTRPLFKSFTLRERLPLPLKLISSDLQFKSWNLKPFSSNKFIQGNCLPIKFQNQNLRSHFIREAFKIQFYIEYL
ncbi:hypothetical protein E2320_013662, partial [Naja naja]